MTSLLAEAIPDHADRAQPCRILCDHSGRLPAIEPEGWDVCLTTAPRPPRPWVQVSSPAAEAARLRAAMAENPQASALLLDLLRRDHLQFDDAIMLESLAFSSLLGGTEFARWLARRGPSSALAEPAEPVTYTRTADAVTLTLRSTIAHNAYSAHMRDALCHALDTCLVDPTAPTVRIISAGRAFCTGGGTWEFGTAPDLAQAHAIRMEQSAAARISALGQRVTIEINGAAIGSGIEIAAAAGRVVAGSKAWFQLPERAMGLIPGAGGTATIPRRVGRHRAAWMVLSGRRVDAATALHWGLIDAIVGA